MPKPTEKQLTEALEACTTACIAYTQPVEVRSGVKLCASGRVMRAMHIANQQPKEKWSALQTEIERLSKAADAKLTAWMQAEHDYNELCKAAGVEPSRILPGETCRCEGCLLVEEGIFATHKLPALPKEHWCTFSTLVEAQTMYANIAKFFEAVIGVDRTNNLFMLCAPQNRIQSTATNAQHATEKAKGA